jgi:hypothetical protein
MADVKVELNYEAVGELLRSQEAADVCMKHASRIQRSLGGGYESNVQIGKVRAVAEVRAYSKKAIKETLESNTLLKAVTS